MKAQFFIISSVIIIYIVILSFQYLTGFSDIRITQIEEQQELSFIPSIKNSLIQTFHASNNSSDGDFKKIVKDIEFTENFFKQQMLKRGIDFDTTLIIFSNSFETNDFSKWSGQFGNPEIVNTNYYGNYSLYSDDVEYVYKSLSGLNEVYARVYVNFSELPSSPNTHYFMSFFDSGNQILNLGLWNDQDNYKLRIYSQSMGTSWTSPSINIREGREYYYEGGWQYFEMHYFELYWYEDETDSKIKAWFDGDLKIDETVDSLGSGDSIDEYRFGGVGVDGIGNPSFYIDCIAISNEYVGEECYPDDEPYFVFSLKSKGMETKTDFGYEEIYEGWYYYFTPFDGVLWFKFNEARGTTAYDSSPYGNYGTFFEETFNDGTRGSTSNPDVNDPSRVSGYFGEALEFDGSNDYAQVPNLDLLNPNYITVGAWIYPNTDKLLPSGTATSGMILKKIIWANEQGYFFQWNNNTKTVSFNIGNGTDWRTASSTTNSVPVGQWTYVAGTYDGSYIRVYINGVLNNTRTHFGPIAPSIDNLRIGAESSTYKRFNGTIDEVRIWDRRLYESEIQKEMQSSLPIIRPIASWSFEETGQYINDTHIWVKGKYNSALSFDGTDDYVNVSSFNPHTYNEFTIMAWYKSSTSSVVDDQYIFLHSDGIDWVIFGPTDDIADDKLRFEMRVDGSENHYYGTSDIVDQTWKHLAAVRNSTHINLYVNGVLENSTADPGSGIPCPVDGSIGPYIGDNPGVTEQVNGIVDEVRIWDRVLTQAEIQAEKNRGS